ncbi:MAG: hypothetical protein AAF443_04675 [Chlamydiota bacterium]
MFNSNFLEFLSNQFQLYYNNEESVKEVFEALKETKSPKEIMELADKRCLSNFQSVNASTHFSNALIQYDLIGYFLDGKIIMEFPDAILSYFEKVLRFQKEKYPIVDCVKVMISD